MLFPSNLFEGRAPEGCAGLSAIYRTADVEDMQQQEDQLVECALQDLERAQGFRPRARVRTSACVRWGRGIPHYGIGHRRRVGELLEAARPLEELYLFGNWHGGISLDDRIAAGRQAADALLQKVSA